MGCRHVLARRPDPLFACDCGGAIQQVRLDFDGAGQSSRSMALTRHVPEPSRAMTEYEAVRHTLERDIAKDTQKDDRRRRFARPNLPNAKRLAVDEIAIDKGHRRPVVVWNSEGGAAVREPPAATTDGRVMTLEHATRVESCGEIVVDGL